LAVPAVGNVTVALAPAAMLPEPVKAAPLTGETVCAALSMFVKVIVPPDLTVTLAGLNLNPWIVTVAVAGALEVVVPVVVPVPVVEPVLVVEPVPVVVPTVALAPTPVPGEAVPVLVVAPVVAVPLHERSKVVAASAAIVRRRMGIPFIF
jgi:hypothetical protein